MRDTLIAPDLDTTAIQRQQAAFEEQTVEQFVSVRSVASSLDATFGFGPRASRPTNAALGDRYFATDRNWLYCWDGTQWVIIVGLWLTTDAARAAAVVNASDNGAAAFTTDTNKLWRVSSGAWVDSFVSIDVTTGYEVAGVKVVGAQGAVVADPAGGAVIDVEARAQLSLLLTRLRTHGLIAT